MRILYTLINCLYFLASTVKTFLIPHFYHEYLILDDDENLIMFFAANRKNVVVVLDDELKAIKERATNFVLVKGFRMFGWSFGDTVVNSGELPPNGEWLELDEGI